MTKPATASRDEEQLVALTAVGMLYEILHRGFGGDPAVQVLLRSPTIKTSFKASKAPMENQEPPVPGHNAPAVPQPSDPTSPRQGATPPTSPSPNS